MHLVEPGRHEPVVALLVQREPGVDDVRASRSIAATTSSAPAICGTRAGLTKLTASMRGDARGREAIDELGAGLRLEDLRVVLEAVPRRRRRRR